MHFDGRDRCVEDDRWELICDHHLEHRSVLEALERRVFIFNFPRLLIFHIGFIGDVSVLHLSDVKEVVHVHLAKWD